MKLKNITQILLLMLLCAGTVNASQNPEIDKDKEEYFEDYIYRKMQEAMKKGDMDSIQDILLEMDAHKGVDKLLLVSAMKGKNPEKAVLSLLIKGGNIDEIYSSPSEIFKRICILPSIYKEEYPNLFPFLETNEFFLFQGLSNPYFDNIKLHEENLILLVSNLARKESIENVPIDIIGLISPFLGFCLGSLHENTVMWFEYTFRNMILMELRRKDGNILISRNFVF